KILQQTWVVLVFALAIIPDHVSAELEIEHYQVFQTTRCRVLIRGEITAADAEELASSNCPGPVIKLSNSPGGDLRAGMKIGRWIRENQAEISVRMDQYCYSTCALVFISGVVRYNFGVVGLHRPYLAGSPQPKETIPALVSAMRDDIRTYVSEMGVRLEFASVMLETLPEQMRLYHKAEIYDLVAKRDAVYDEIEVARYARHHGISTDEYRRRDQEADSECDFDEFNYRGGGIDYEVCRSAVRSGLSRSVYRRRIESIASICGHLLSDERLSTDQGITKANECRLDVMRGVPVPLDVSGLKPVP
ncbi:MAG: hypothetical protein O3A13_15945, partial [Proteobacteria bacterium]|nr:hypothetical protein [Pseudomonadota bacterium]